MESTASRLLGTIVSWTLKLIIYVAIVFVIYKGMTIAYQFGHDIFYATTMSEPPGTDMTVTITEDMRASEAGDLLYEYGLITNKYSFIVQSIFFDLDLNAGTYIFNTSQTSREILEQIDAGIEESTDDNES